MSKRARIILIVSAIVVMGGLVILGFILKSQPQKTQSAGEAPTATLHVNQDTGEQTITDPALGDSESQDSSNLVIYGMADLIQKVALYQAQIEIIKADLQAYSSQNLGNKYSSLTIRPQDFAVNGDTLTTTLRLGDGNNIVNLQINGIVSGSMQLFITDPTDTNGGNYTSAFQDAYGD